MYTLWASHDLMRIDPFFHISLKMLLLIASFLVTWQNKALSFCVFVCVGQTAVSFEFFYWKDCKQLWPKRVKLKVTPSKTAAVYDAMPNCFVPWHEFRSLTSPCAHTRARTQIFVLAKDKCVQQQRSGHRSALLRSQPPAEKAITTTTTTTTTTVRLIMVMVWGCVQRLKMRTERAKGDSGNVVARLWSVWRACCDLLISLDLCARTRQPRFCKQNSHYAH